MWARLYVLRSNLGGIHNARNDADRKCNAPEGTFDSVSPWGLSSPVKKRTMEGGGRRHEGRRGRPLDVLVEWEGEDSDGGDLWVTFGRNPGSASPTFQRTYAKKREGSRASFLAPEGRGPLAGEPSGETR